MNIPKLTFAVIVSVTPVAYGLAVQVPQRQSPRCVTADGREAKLPPHDDGVTRADFAEFRRRLQKIVADKNVDALVRVLDPKIEVAFDGAEGIDAFKEYHLNSPQEEFWTEFGRILMSGGRFVEKDLFSAPYVSIDWPVDIDSFECVAVMGTGVRLRERPSSTGRILATLDYSIVQPIEPDSNLPATDGWQRVQIADGRTGYVSREYLRSPLDHRVLFRFKEGQWWVIAYVAGD